MSRGAHPPGRSRRRPRRRGADPAVRPAPGRHVRAGLPRPLRRGLAARPRSAHPTWIAEVGRRARRLPAGRRPGARCRGRETGAAAARSMSCTFFVRPELPGPARRRGPAAHGSAVRARARAWQRCRCGPGPTTRGLCRAGRPQPCRRPDGAAPGRGGLRPCCGSGRSSLNVSRRARGRWRSGRRRSTTSRATPLEPDWVDPPARATAGGPNLSLNLGETRPDAVPHIHLDLYADDQALRGRAAARARRPARRGLALPRRAARLRRARGPGRQPVLRHRHHRPLGGTAVTLQPGPTNTLTDVPGPAGRARDPHRAGLAHRHHGRARAGRRGRGRCGRARRRPGHP